MISSESRKRNNLTEAAEEHRKYKAQSLGPVSASFWLNDDSK